jgi:hypothetical protein
MNYTMKDHLKIITPHLNSELVSPQALSNIHKLADVLPPFSFGVFESRLGSAQSRVDFSIRCFKRSIPDSLQGHPLWQPLENFYREWANPTSFIHKGITDIWLEFDLDKQSSQLSMPGIFLTLNQEIVSDAISLLKTVLQLLNYPLAPKLETNLQCCISSLPKSATCIHFGMMLSRGTKAIRVDVSGISPQQLLEYLVQIGWTHNLNTLKSLVSIVSGLTDCIILSFDIDDTLQPRIGLECFLHKNPKDEPRWQLFSNYLVEAGLCTPAKQTALLDWPGLFQDFFQPGLSSDNLNGNSYSLDPKVVSIFGKKISHVKIVYHPDTHLQAKAYLSFAHDYFDNSLLN